MPDFAYFDIKQDEHPEKATVECWCGGDKLKWSPVCYYCYDSLPQEIRDKLHKQYGRGYEEAYIDAITSLAQTKGYGDDIRSNAERLLVSQ